LWFDLFAPILPAATLEQEPVSLGTRPQSAGAGGCAGRGSVAGHAAVRAMWRSRSCPYRVLLQVRPQTPSPFPILAPQPSRAHSPASAHGSAVPAREPGRQPPAWAQLLRHRPGQAAALLPPFRSSARPEARGTHRTYMALLTSETQQLLPQIPAPGDNG